MFYINKNLINQMKLMLKLSRYFSFLLFLVPSLNLRCPLCPEIPPFTRAELFRKHMADSTRHLTATHFFNFKQRFLMFSLHFRNLEIHENLEIKSNEVHIL